MGFSPGSFVASAKVRSLFVLFLQGLKPFPRMNAELPPEPNWHRENNKAPKLGALLQSNLQESQS